VRQCHGRGGIQHLQRSRSAEIVLPGGMAVDHVGLESAISPVQNKYLEALEQTHGPINTSLFDSEIHDQSFGGVLVSAGPPMYDPSAVAWLSIPPWSKCRRCMSMSKPEERSRAGKR